MSSSRTRRPLTAPRAVLALVTAAIAIVSLWALLRSAGDHDTAAGVVVGGAAVLVLASIGLWRVLRRPELVGTASRALAGVKDERDRAIVGGAFSWTGYAAVASVVVSTIAVALSTDPLVMLRLVTIAVYVTFVGAFVVLSRRS